MGDRLKIDYNMLNDAKRDLTALSDTIDPTLNGSIFSTLATEDSSSILGAFDIYSAVYDLHDNAGNTMDRAKKKIKELADSFGSVGEAFLQFDAELSQGMSITGNNLKLGNYNRDKANWEYYQEHKSECENIPPGQDVPGFCSATDPGDPPLDQTITTDRGNIHTHLTLDDSGQVVKEESTVTYDGKTYYSVTTYSDDRHHAVTDTTYPDGSTVHNDTHLNDDGSGTMKTTNSDGTWKEYTRGADGSDNPDHLPAKWVETQASIDANKPDDPDDTPEGPPPRTSGGGSKLN
ncbi:hypothetical protein [Kribbella sp. NPDC055071]